MFRILVVDDEEPIRDMLSDALVLFGYEVVTAVDGVDALEKLEKDKFDLVLSDINMPNMTGFELLGEVEKHYPEIKRVLITAYNLDDYMRMVRDYNIGNVIAKTAPFNFDEIKSLLHGLLNKKIFGLEQHLLSTSTKKHFSLCEPSQIELISDELMGFYSSGPESHKFKVVLIELMTNALFYGMRGESGDNKQDWIRDFKLPDEEAVHITFGMDNEKVGVSVLDRGGKLDKHTVLYWLDRQITRTEEGLPAGLMDFHGRGLYITRKYVDRFLINIEKEKRCECCIFNYFHERYAGYKPLLINEI